MIAKFSNRRSSIIFLSTVIFLVALIARLLPGPRTIDDSFITYRYARNILAGNGFVYNPGEHVLGTTTPLYTILLVGLGSISGGEHAYFPEIAWILNAFIDGINCLLLLHIGKKLNSTLAGIFTALIWSIAPYSVTFSIGGLETSLIVMLLLISSSAYLQESYTLAMVFCALSFLTRPDSLIFSSLLVIHRTFQYWKILLKDKHQKYISLIIKEAAVLIVPMIAWMIFASFYFGNPLPNSMAAKTVAYQIPGNTAFIRLIQHYATPFLGHLTFGTTWVAAGMVIYPTLFFIGALHSIKSNSNFFPLLIYPWLYFLVFSLVNPLIFRWYLTPPLPFYILIIFIGLERFFGHFKLFGLKLPPQYKSNLDLRSRILHGMTGVLLIIWMVPIIFTLRGWVTKADHGLPKPAPEMAYIQLELLYHRAAEYLLTTVSVNPNSILLAAGDVGVLGYDTSCQILDTVGLNSPQVLKYYPLNPDLYAINYAISPDLIIDYKPDYLIILEVYGRYGLLIDDRFLTTYHQINKLDTNIYGSHGMLIFKRNMP